MMSLFTELQEIVVKHTHTQKKPFHRDLVGHHDVAVQLLDRMQILRNQCSDAFQDTA